MLLIIALILALIFLPWPVNFAVILATGVIEISVAFFGIRYSRHRRARVGVETLIGQTAETITTLNPDGQVNLNGEIWKAHTQGLVTSGQTVRVIAIYGLTVEVESA